MTYSPSESEKRLSCVIQALAAVFFFIPPLIARSAKRVKNSPYVRYWNKVCLVWSLLSAALLVVGSAVAISLNLPGPATLVLIVHFIFCVFGGLCSHFNTPFRYWFVANKFCEPELADVYGQLLPAPPVAKD